MSPLSPTDYIISACQLHLGDSNLSENARKEVEKFLSGEGLNEGGVGGNKASQRLFVWSTTKVGEDIGTSSGTICEASCFQLPKSTRYFGALVFCRADNIAASTATSGTGEVSEGGETATATVSNAVTSVSQIQCMTLQPPSSEASDVEDIDGVSMNAHQQQTPTAILSTLQLITRQCFLPTVQSVLQDDAAGLDTLSAKIRELTLALQASSRSARLPQVNLSVDDRIQAAAAQMKGDTKIDWQALGLADCLEDDTYLNGLQAGVSQWIVQIRKVTILPKTTPFVDGNAAEELAFWSQLQAELNSINQQLKEPAVTLQLSLLRETKRFVATLALENNTGIEQAGAITNDVVNFLQGYPLQQLQAAVDSFDKIVAAVRAIFDHFPKIRQSRYYSLERSVELFEATTGVLKDSLLAVLTEQFPNLLFMDYKEYERAVRYPCVDIFAQFNDRFSEWKDFILEQARRRKLTGMNRVLEKITLRHTVVSDRLDQIHEFRSSQETLRSVVHTVLREEEPEALQQVESAPRQIFSMINVLDLSPNGNQALEAALEEYDLQMDAMEERLARLLRDKLTACRDAEDMFRVFARFNLLLTRTRVRAAVKEFQMQLINTVSEAIGRLQSKFTLKYESSAAARISRLRGIPPVAGKILWAKQMERQVNTLMERMGNVLGPNWGQQLEGRQLRKSGDELLAKLDARSFFRNWVQEWEKDLASVTTSRLHSYPIIVEPDGRSGDLVAKVNFDEKSELLFKEIRHLKWLGFTKDIPRTLIMVSDEAVGRYPFAVAVKTALRSYQAVRVLVTPELEPLVMPQLIEIRECIAEAFDVKLSGSAIGTKKRRIRWDTPEMTDWVTRLTESVTKLEDRVEQLLRACDKVDIALNLLEQVNYDTVKFRSVLASIQKTIDEMSLSGYSDLDTWVRVVGDKMADVLAKRLEGALKAWNKSFKMHDKNISKSSETLLEDGDHSEVEDETTIPEMTISTNVNLEIVLRNQEITTVPSLPTVRSIFLSTLHDFIGVVCNLPRPKSGRYEVFDNVSPDQVRSHETFDNLDCYINPKIIAEAYSSVEDHIQDAATFIDQWLAYQSLWDTQVSDVAATVGNDIEKWHGLLLEASEARSTLDSSATSAEFGPILVKYGKVQSQINLKYDSWQKELQSSFASILSQCIAEAHDKISKAKSTLEETTLDSASTENIVLGVTFIQECKQKMDIWDREIEGLKESEKVLKRQRFVFHSEWMETSVVRGLCDSLAQILERRNRTMEQQVPVLQARVSAEDKSASKQLVELLKEWTKDKPLRGTMTPTQAMSVLVKYELTLKKAHVHQENLVRAKDALGLEHTVENTEVIDALNELADLKEVWEAVTEPFAELQKLKDTPWSTAVMRKVRRGLDDLLASMRSLPNRIRQYDAYEQLHEAVKGYVAGHGLLTDLKTEALKERHWKTILQRLGIRLPVTDLTIGILWDNGVLNRKKDMLEILAIAQGEMALEVFLGQVRDRWLKQELDLVLFQNRTRLIRGWDDLFACLDDHIGGLAQMKNSPYFRSVAEFQEEAKLWEDRLTKLRAAFDAWVDVQRRWVYLEGILFGGSDIKAQLPAEWSRFKSVDSEFVALMRRISNKPFAMEVLNIDNLQRTLERLGNLMSVIQRALGEYLTKQRSDFSRFYFLGDDDLLEIMGNAGEPGKVLSHVSKMFAGIAGAKVVTENLGEGVRARLDAMVSKDGEIVPFHEPIEITQQKNVKDWLKEVETNMQTTLALLLEKAVNEDNFSADEKLDETSITNFVNWTIRFPAQVMILAAQINWSMGVDKALAGEGVEKALNGVLQVIVWKLEVMANTVLTELPADHRKKFEQLITELVRQRDVIRSLIDEKVVNISDFRWLYHLRYNYNPKAGKLTEKLTVSLSNAKFYYGFEYLGIGERLVQTPLTDRCYLTLTQALHFRMGGSPFGPAGTGKTESVKALGAALGRFVLVFNCDETFDFSAMGRLLAGLSQVGAWGCFDEFNRLEERILSAVSQQILTIQRGLIERQSTIELLGRSISLHDNVGIFITMNPGYEGRSNLPDNLKNLFRSFAMVVPDRKLIAQVMLFSQGIVTAEALSGKVVDLFQLCESKMSKQRHYDFGLRALKTLLVSAGALKRQAFEGKMLEGEAVALAEQNALIVGACNNVLPKLVAEDMPVFAEVLQMVFPGSSVATMDDDKVREEIIAVCMEHKYVPAEGFIQKVLQLKQVLENRHGVMVVGKAGKSAALQVLLQVLEKLDGVKGDMHIIDPKAINKDKLYGSLDGTTLEWTDGVVTSLLRRVIDNQKGESDRRHWIVFDGDVDPDWAENLNSVLDDNKMLTLPSGERLSIPSNVRIILEVDSLKHATPATVSRCGMVWFSDENITTDMALEHLLGLLETKDVVGDRAPEQVVPPAQVQFLSCIKPMFHSERTSSLVVDALDYALKVKHVMEPSRNRLINTLKALLIQGISLAVEYDENHPDFPMSGEHMEKFAKHWLLHSLMWSFCGSASWDVRKQFSGIILRTSGVMLPGGEEYSVFDYRVRVEDGEWELWSDSVPRMEIESHRAAASDVVITTTDTVRHSDVLGAWLARRIPLVLCGPPGSGKTMTLISVLQSIQGVVLANLNFSSRTTPEIILKTFAQYCSYVRRGKDLYLEPAENLGAQSWLVVFCDEINLPEEDTYGTQRVIMFMRQLVEHGGFWRGDNVWVRINRIQFVGACNPPADAGRVEMSNRFLRHVPLLLVDFPAKDSLIQIYRTFNGGMMKLFPNLKGETEAMTEAMVEVYLENQKRFTPEIQPQYFYSPRELSRWVRGIYESVVNLDQGLSREELVRIWAHEGLRLFADRLVEESDRIWCNDSIDTIARKWFAGVDFEEALKRPMFFTSWLSKDTRRVERDELKYFLGARLRVFYEEELDVPLVIFDDVLQHVLRIDRVLRQPMGHLLLVGDSGAGKTVLSKFVSWMNGLNIFQIKAHSRYGMDDFNEDLRGVMRRVGVDGEKVCFIFDESNVLSSGFIEAINALLASGEVPGLFDGDEYTSLMSSVRDAALRDGVILDSEEEIWRHFTGVVQRNLHVVFTVNPSGGDWKNRSTTSPALFNRCVVDWFGTWDNKALAEVGKEFTTRLDMGDSEDVGGAFGIGQGEALMKVVEDAFQGSVDHGLHQAVVAVLVSFHQIAKSTSDKCAAEASSITRTFLSPRDYLALIQNFVSCLNGRRETVEDEQLHVNAGLDKLRQTQDNVAELKEGLGIKTSELRKKESLANEKLQQMVADQNEAEKRKGEAEKISAQIEKQQKEINNRRDEAQRDLDEAEPALKSALESVRGIKKRDLDEIRNLARPPNNVKLTLECVAIMLGEKSVEWAEVRKLLSKAEFIPSIINFDADKLSIKQIKLVKEKYLDGNPELNAEAVTRSSKACGPLYKWAESQIKYSTIYNNVQPLREEVDLLEQEAMIVKEQKEEIESEVKRLESSIAQYKTDYASLIRDVEALKSEMEAVTTKIERAESLLKSLGHESQRWAKSSETFQTIMRSLVGDGLLMAAYLTYAGFFDFKTRLQLLQQWKATLESLGIEFRDDLGIVETLSTASQRLKWQSQGLPSDQLSLENGVILDRASRFPLVIDPSGQAINFIMTKYNPEKIQTTSFLDKAFTKTLSSAVRFGTALLVENVERIDPILNPILNKELQRTGGRTLVRIGTEEVDYSPKFKIFLSTKNPAVQLTPDLCSRVTLVNFTVTPDSLQSQSLSKVVKAMKPELEKQRASLLKLQSEQNVKLRELESQMLAKISACEGSILDSDRVVEGMEVLMREGAQVEEKISHSEEVMKEVRQVVARFEPFAGVCRQLFVLLEALRDTSFLYEFPAKTFMLILDQILGRNLSSPDTEESARIGSLKNSLFEEIAARIGRGLLYEDKLVLSILLARLQSGDNTIGSREAQSSDELIQLVQNAFGDKFPWQGRALSDLAEVSEQELSSTVPLLICCSPGHDVSSRVEGLARELKKELSAVAMGSSEGFETAETLVATASKRGTWVLLKNVHLCVDWLRESLVKKVNSLGPGTHKDFRLFITSEINPRLPTALLRLSDKMVCESPSGIKATLSRFFPGIPKDRFSSTVRTRLYMLLGWTHAVIQERLRFVPVGWTEAYEWTEADATHGLDVIDSLLDDGRTQQSDPEKLPWDAIRSTLVKGVFGGRITSDIDQKILDDLVHGVFVPASFNVDFKLVPGVPDCPLLPDGNSRDHFKNWIENLPARTPPTWIGLDSSVELDREKRMADRIIKKVAVMQTKCYGES